MGLVNRRDVLKMIGLLAAVGISGCDGGEHTADSPQTTAGPEATASTRNAMISVDIDHTGQIYAVFPDGTEAHGQDAYEAAVAQLAQQMQLEEVEIEFGDNLAQQLTEEIAASDTSFQDQSALRFEPKRFLGFTLTGGPNRRHVNGCINRYTNYFAIRLNYGDQSQGNYRPLFDFHFAKWINERGQSCTGVYESVWKIPFTTRPVVNVCPLSRNFHFL